MTTTEPAAPQTDPSRSSCPSWCVSQHAATEADNLVHWAHIGGPMDVEVGFVERTDPDDQDDVPPVIWVEHHAEHYSPDDADRIGLSLLAAAQFARDHQTGPAWTPEPAVERPADRSGCPPWCVLPCDGYGHWGTMRGVDATADPTVGGDPDSITVARYTHLDRGHEIPECVLVNVHSFTGTDRDLHLTPAEARRLAGLLLSSATAVENAG